MTLIITDSDTGRRLWRTVECAEHCGISPATWSSYVLKQMPPKPVAMLDKRSPLWDAESVKEWHANRPGGPHRR